MNSNDNSSNPYGTGGTSGQSGSGQASGTEDLISNVKSVVDDAQALLRGGSEQMGINYEAALERFERTLEVARTNLSTLEEQVMAGTKEAMETTDRYVQENPWQAVGIGAAAGLLIGLLLGRNR